MTITPVDEKPGKLGSIGVLLSNIEARLVDDDGKDSAKGERGELWIRGKTVMKGYWRNRKATEDSITKDGWFQTGDVAIVDDDGYYYIVDRKKGAFSARPVFELPSSRSFVSPRRADQVQGLPSPSRRLGEHPSVASRCRRRRRDRRVG